MTKIGLAAGFAALTCFSAVGVAEPAATGAVKLSKADCQAIWSKADSSDAGSLTATQAQPYLTNFKAVDANADGKVSGDEFLNGCQKGMAHDAASAGGSSGASGSDSSAAPAQKPAQKY
ncbi:MAG: hypothetical protein ACT4OU_04660 [Hyphomicrobium sp.]